ncbi:hypothetical protein PR202_gb08373 [Eleusine coracana subsp. coracana]|uniref:Uncharacterized protein n=1 Tax=Eleusine coracana subsp. coracana TaxID=191504 RepID=A0AAV5ECW0_ELECO|nr:hypothetical protein PR202_gb08373 [Eleusine coracana subsp. coracana]
MAALSKKWHQQFTMWSTNASKDQEQWSKASTTSNGSGTSPEHYLSRLYMSTWNYGM